MKISKYFSDKKFGFTDTGVFFHASRIQGIPAVGKELREVIIETTPKGRAVKYAECDGTPTDIFGYRKGGWFVQGVTSGDAYRGTKPYIEIRWINTGYTFMDGAKKRHSLSEAREEALERVQAWKDRMTSRSSNPEFTKRIQNAKIEIRVTYPDRKSR